MQVDVSQKQKYPVSVCYVEQYSPRFPPKERSNNPMISKSQRNMPNPNPATKKNLISIQDKEKK